jgi:hypothetical protein
MAGAELLNGTNLQTGWDLPSAKNKISDSTSNLQTNYKRIIPKFHNDPLTPKKNQKESSLKKLGLLKRIFI